MFFITAPTRPFWLMLVFFFGWGSALSAAPLSLTPALTLTAPNGGQTLTPTDSTTLTWTSSGLSGNVRIELSRDAGTIWEVLADSVGNTGSWLWRIAGAGTTEGLIRVSSLSEPGLADASDAPFTIKQSQLTLLTPNGGQNFQQGDGVNISWSGTNFYGGVKVELSKDNGLNWDLLSSGNSITSSTVWTVQGAATSQGRVRVTALRSSEISDTSDLPFSLLESTLVLTSPKGGQAYTPGDGLILTWAGANFVGGVNVDLSRDLGGSWERILSGAPVSANTSWLIRGQGTTQAMVRVSSVRNPNLFDVSDAPFTIKQSQLALTSPVGGQMLTPGDITTFTWVGANFLGGFNLELSRDNGANWEMLSTQYATSGSYSWRVQGQGTSEALARVTPLRLPELADISDANFTIKQSSLSLSTPNGGQSFTPGDGMLVTWSGSNFVGGVNLELSRDSGTTWETFLAGAPTSGSTAWTVRGQGTTSALVRVSSTRLPEISDRSDTVFTIKQSSLTLLSPNGGEKILQGTTHNVTWSVSNLIGTIQVELSRDNGSSWETLTSSAATAGPYAWAVSQANTSAALLRIRSTRLPELSDSSNAVFQISTDTLQLTRPTGFTIFQAGSTDLISWTTNVPGPFKLEFSGNGGGSWSTLTNSASGTSYNWVVDATLTTQGLIRVSSVDDPQLSSTNQTPFSIQAPTVALSQPGYPPSYFPGTTAQFTWSSASPGPFDLEYSGNGGASWTTLATSYPSKSYTWTVDGTPTNQGFFRVRLTNYPSSSSTNTLPFTIIEPTFSLTKPSGSSIYTVGTAQQIFWSTNVPGLFKLEFSKDGAATWSTIAASVANRSYYWVVGYTPTTQGFVRVSSLSFPDYSAINEAPFTIPEPQLTLATPNGGESFTPGDGMRLTWSGSGFVGAVNVELTRDDGVSWEPLLSNVAINNSTTVRVSGQGTTTGRVRVSSKSHPEVFDVSDTVFTIKQSQLNLISPNGGEAYNVGTPVVVSWSVANLIGGVDLAVSLDGGSTWSNISTLNLGSNYVWTATESTTQALFRVSATRLPSLFDLSDGFVSVKEGSVALTNPIHGESLDIGSYINLSHSSVNCYGNFDYHLSWDGGITWLPIASTPSASAPWQVTGPPATPGLIRVSLANAPAIFDIGEMPISIEPYGVSFVSPSGGEAYDQGQGVSIQVARSHYKADVRIQISLNNGASWQGLADLGSSATSVAYWTVSQAPSTTVLLRLTNATGSEVFDTLETPLTIREGRLTITMPNGGEALHQLSYQSITVERENLVGTLVYQLSRNGGASWESLGSSAGDFGWSVSGQPTEQALIRVSINSVPGVRDTSDAVFTILPFSVTLNSPSSGQSYGIGSIMTIDWIQDYLGSSVVEVSCDGRASWTRLAITNQGFNWVVTCPNPTNNAWIRVKNNLDPSIFDEVGPLTFFSCPSLGALGNISSPGTVCAGTTVSYSVPELSGAVTYSWFVNSYNGRVVSGQGTPNVSVIWDLADTLQVTAIDACRNASSKSKNINVNSGFTGSGNVFPGNRITYSPDSGSGSWAVSCQNCTFSEQNRDLIVDWGATETATISFTQSSCTHERTIQVSSSLMPDFAAVGTGDFDNNGLDDLLWYQPETGESRAWLALPEGDYRVVAMPTQPKGFWRYLGMMRTSDTGPKGMLWTDELGNFELLSAESTETWSETAIPLRVDGWPLGLADIDGDSQGELLTIDPEGTTWVNVLKGSETLDRFPLETEVVPDSEIDLLIRSAGRTRPLDEVEGWWYLGSFATDEEAPLSALYYHQKRGELGLSQADDSALAPLMIRGQAVGSDLSTIFDPETTIQLERDQTKESPK